MRQGNLWQESVLSMCIIHRLFVFINAFVFSLGKVFTFTSDSFGEKVEPETFRFRLNDPFSFITYTIQGYWDFGGPITCREFCVLSRIPDISGDVIVHGALRLYKQESRYPGRAVCSLMVAKVSSYDRLPVGCVTHL